MNAVAFAAGKIADSFLLVGSLEVELRDVRPRGNAAIAEIEKLQFVGDFLPNGFLVAKGVAALVDVAHNDAVADLEGAGVGLFLSEQDLDHRRLAGAVGSNDADD